MQERRSRGSDNAEQAQQQQRRIESDDKPIVPVNSGHQLFAQCPQGRQFRQVSTTQGDVCRFSGNVRSITHGNRNICRCQCRSIVDAVAHHDNAVPIGFQLFHIAVLVLRQHLCKTLGDSQLCCGHLCRLLAVAGQHHNIFNACFFQQANCFPGFCTGRI